MPPAVIAEIGLAVGIVAAIALDAVLNTVAALGFVGDDGAEQQAADNPGRNRAAVTAVMATATSVSRAAAVPVLRLNKQRAVAGLRLRRRLEDFGAASAIRRQLVACSGAVPARRRLAIQRWRSP